MSFVPDLVLRDIHEPVVPAWWPPAPGWWIAALALLAVVAWAGWRRWRRIRRQHAAERLFEATLAAQPDGSPQRIAAMSELLRRAARRTNADADRLQGEDWLRLLDTGLSGQPFTSGAGRVLLDGGFRRDVAQADMEALEQLVRARFLDWMDAA